MLTRRLVPTLTSVVAVSGLLTFLSCDIDAKQEKAVKMETQSKRPSKCCTAGYGFCPTGGDHGCDCCGVSVKGTLTSYENKEGKLKIDGLDEEVPFHVEDQNVGKVLSTMKNKSGTFILKVKLYEYDLSPPPHDNPKLKHWHGKRFECESVGDKGNMKDRTAEFIEGWKTSSKIHEVRTKLEELVPQYDPERDEDRRP